MYPENSDNQSPKELVEGLYRAFDSFRRKMEDPSYIQLEASIKQMALTTNVKYITFSSHRRGWSKRAVQYGFRPKLWICEV